MKQVTVKSASGQVQVNLNNANDSDTLTPRMARAAVQIAFGVGAHATVSDGVTTYRVTRSRERKI